MKSPFIAIIVCTVGVMLGGCSTHKAAIEARVKHDIDRCHQDLRARFPIWRHCATNLLAKLSSANPVTLKGPQFASAVMGRDSDGEYRLIVYWLQDKPSVDATELQMGSSNRTTTIAISDSDLKSNIKVSNVSVVFVGTWVWSKANSIWNKLEKIRNVANLKARLMTDGKPVTKWHPVAFYRLDHWMGTKEMKAVKRGPSDPSESDSTD